MDVVTHSIGPGPEVAMATEPTMTRAADAVTLIAVWMPALACGFRHIAGMTKVVIRNLGRWISALVVGVLAITLQVHAQSPMPWRVWDHPLSMTRIAGDDLVVQRSSASTDPCHYDANGQVVPGTGLDCRYDHLYRPAGRHRYLYARDNELVLLDEPGAGVLSRIWMTTGNGYSVDFPDDLRLRVRLGEMPTPFIDLPVRQWFDGSTWPFTGALVGDRHSAAGAAFSYVPIRFSHGIRISLVGPDTAIDAAPIWYHFNVHRLPPAHVDGDGFPPDVDAYRNFAATAPGLYPWPQALTWQSTTLTLSAGDEAAVFDHDRADTLLALRIRTDTLAQLQSLRVRLWFDGESRIEQSVAELLGLDLTQEDDLSVLPQTLLSGIGADQRTAYLYLPMPFQKSASLQLSQPADAGPVQVEIAHAFAGSAPPADALRVRAQSHEVCVAGGRLAPDLPLLDLHGRGRWVGMSVWQHNLVLANPAFLEGDERVYVDGSRDPLWPGTGNEDFYNGGFYFDRDDTWGWPHARPFAGAPRHAFRSDVLAASRMYRWLLADAVAFHSRLQVNVERGAYGDLPMCSRGVAWLYHEPERRQAPLFRLDLGDPTSTAVADYQPPAGTVCDQRHGVFPDQPPTAATLRTCEFVGGASQFALKVPADSGQLWLRRRFDASAGGQAASVAVDGSVVARFPPVAAAAAWRWQEITVPLDLAPATTSGTRMFRIIPDDPAAGFTEVAYALLGDVSEPLFADGFDPAD